MMKRGFVLAFDLRYNPLSQSLAKLDAPLVERVNIPDRSLREYAVLVKRNQFSEIFRREPVSEDGVGWAVAFKHAVWRQPIRCALIGDLLRRFPKGQRLGLSKDVRHQQVVMASERV